jgi:hypothetical protein
MNRPQSFFLVSLGVLALALAPHPRASSAATQADDDAFTAPGSPAGLPDATHCTVPSRITPGGTCTVTICDLGNFPIPNSRVVLSFAAKPGLDPCSLSPCTGCNWDPVTRTLWAFTDLLGHATFPINTVYFGACFDVPVTADGIPIGSISLCSASLPLNKQDGTGDCGPASAASMLKRFQENGYPDLKTRDGKSGLKDYENQLEKDAGTDATLTWANKLVDAINRLIDGTPCKGQLRARLPLPSDLAYTSFGYLDSEFAHGETILLLLSYPQNPDDPKSPNIHHYVAVNDLKGSGGTRSCEYMDPYDGSLQTGTMTIGTDGNLHLTLDDGERVNNCKVFGIITTSPPNAVTSSAAPVDPNDPAAGTNLTYTIRYPSNRPTKDLHVWVADTDMSHYEVTGLPAAPGKPTDWKWDVRLVGNRAYLNVWKNGSTLDLPSGNSITVKYTGPHHVIENGANALTPTTDGNGDPTDGVQPPLNGHTVASAVPAEAPPAPSHAGLTLVSVTPTSMTARLSWQAAPDPALLHFEVYDRNSGYLVTETSNTQVLLSGLEPDVIHEFGVVARDTTVLGTADSLSVLVYLDAMGACSIVPGPTQLVHYLPALCSSDAPTRWSLRLPGAETPGNLYVVTLTGSPLVGLAPEVESSHTQYYHLFADVALDPGAIQLSVPYDSVDAVGNETAVRLFALLGGAWTDVTSSVDPDSNLVRGEIPELTTIAIGRLNTSGVPAVELLREFALGRPQPNPSTGVTRVRFEVPRESPVELAIYDMQGRRLAVLSKGVLAPGRHETTWDGKTGGRAAPAGVYFVRLRSAGVDLSRRLVLVR